VNIEVKKEEIFTSLEEITRLFFIAELECDYWAVRSELCITNDVKNGSYLW